MQIQVNKGLSDLPTILLSEVLPIQKKLKKLSESNYKKLKEAVIQKGFCFPVFLWQNEQKYHLLDGHQRQILFEREQWNVPVPYVLVDADSLTDAKEKLLLCTSQFGTITMDGLANFGVDLDWTWVEGFVNFDALPILDFMDLKNTENYELKQPEYERPKPNDKSNICKCPNCGHDFEPK